MTDDAEYILDEQSMTTVSIGKHSVSLIKAEYPDEPKLRRWQWHAVCTEYFDDHISRNDRVTATDSSFYVAAAKAVDAYSNDGEYSDGGAE